jgi:O-antigen polymerase
VVAWPWLIAHTGLPTWLFALRSDIKYKVLALILTLAIVGGGTYGLYKFKQGSSTGKLLIWEVTLGKIAEHPLFGYGVGRFEAEYNNWQGEYFQKHPEEMDGPKGLAAGNTKYAFSDFLELTAETGVVGLLIFVALLVVIMKKLKAMKGIVIFSFFTSFIFLLLFSFPYYSLPTLISLFIALIIASSFVERFFFVYYFPVILLRISSISGLLIGILTLSLGYNQYKCFYIWDEADMLYKTKSFQESCQSFTEVYPKMQYNGAFLQYYGKALSMNYKPIQSLAMSQKARHLISDEVLYTTIGNCYKDTKQYERAEQIYQYAAIMAPHKQYPLYLLAKLYHETHQPLKMNDVAWQLLSKKEKTSSKAINEMREEMRKLLSNSKK